MRLRALYSAIRAFLLLAAIPAFAQDDSATEVLLAEYLAGLGEQGVRVVFSSDLVTDDMRIARPPVDATDAAALADILRPFGLNVKDGPSGTLLVVAAPVTRPKPEYDKPAIQAPIPEIIMTSSLHHL